MFGSVVIDVLIGLTLVFLLLSLVTSAIREALAGIAKSRSQFLHRGIVELLDDPALVADVYRHPLISVLYRGKYEDARDHHDLPSYIPSRSFALALFDMATRGRDARNPLSARAEAGALSLPAVRQRVWLLQNEPVQRVLLSAIDTAEGDLTQAIANVQDWFDSAMDRVSGWYKRRTQLVLFVVGLGLTIASDADTIRIANHLYRDPARRDAAVAMATAVSHDTTLARALGGRSTITASARDSAARIAASDTTVRGTDLARTAVARLDSLGLPLAWSDVHAAADIPGHIARSLLGWLLTAFAISLGAPFWFDTLNRLMVIRSTVKPKEKSGEEASEDRQLPPSRAASADGKVLLVPSGAASSGAGAFAEHGGVTTIPAPPPTDPGFTPQEWESGHPQGGVL